MGRVKNHHFLPQGYLRGFSFQGAGNQIFQITKRDLYRETLISIENAGAVRDFHTIEQTARGRDSAGLEQQLAKLEGIHLEMVKRLSLDGAVTMADHRCL